MAVVRPDYESAPRGSRDAARHREKVREAIRRSLPEVLSEEAIITRKGGAIVKVPIRGLKSYRFVHGRTGEGGGGIGSGESQNGKVVGRRPRKGHAGQAGGEPGVDFLETEIQIEELIHMMLEDLGLPNLRLKEIKETEIPAGWTHDSIEKVGIHTRLDKKRTIREAIKRTEALVAFLLQESGRTEGECREALVRAGGDAAEALRALKQGGGEEQAPLPDDDSGLFVDSADLRFRTLTEDIEHQSNAVVIAMMDVSGSMTTIKKYFARSFFFWMISFLRTLYRKVEIRFIAHTTEAKLVDEEEFFHRGESGGTQCSSAYEAASTLIDHEYSPSRWNIYPFHFSDGEDWDPAKSVQSLQALLERGPSAFGYGEIQTEYSSSVLLNAICRDLDLSESRLNGFEYHEGLWRQTPVLGVVLRGKEDLYPALRVFLNPQTGSVGRA
jgi:sporulation protein YhbH